MLLLLAKGCIATPCSGQLVHPLCELAVRKQCTATEYTQLCYIHTAKSLYFAMGMHISPSKVPLLGVGDVNPRLIQGSLGLHESTSQTGSFVVKAFYTAHGRDKSTNTQTTLRVTSVEIGL